MIDYNQQQSPENGSFVTGFTVGLFAGAAGYYLFATEKGAKLRKQLAAEWEGAKEKLVEEGVIDNPHVSLREFVSELLHKSFGADGANRSRSREYKPVLLAEELEAGRKKAREVSARAKKDLSKKFKGV